MTVFVPFKNKQDFEDYEQERAIQKWINKSADGDFEYKSITRNGKCKHIGDVGAFSMDETHECGAYADIIGGLDYSIERYGEMHTDENPVEHYLEEFLIRLHLKGDTLKWAYRTYLSRINNNKLNL